MTTRQRKQTLLAPVSRVRKPPVRFIDEQSKLMGIDGNGFHGWNDTYDREFDGRILNNLNNPNYNMTKKLTKTSGYEKDDFVVEDDDNILSDSEEYVESDSEEYVESDSEEYVESDSEEEDYSEEDEEDSEEETAIVKWRCSKCGR